MCLFSFQFNVSHLDLLWARPWFHHHHTESNKKATYIREKQIEMSKYISYTMKALEYSKACKEEQTGEKRDVSNGITFSR